MIVGALIIFFLIVEPHGLARLWQIGKQKLEGLAFPVLTVQSAQRRGNSGGPQSRLLDESIEEPAAQRGRKQGRTRMTLKHLAVGNGVAVVACSCARCRPQRRRRSTFRC